MPLCYGAIVRTTIDLSDEAYHIAKAIAREQKRSLGNVVSEFIIGANENTGDRKDLTLGANEILTFRCIRRVTSEDVKAMEDE